MLFHLVMSEHDVEPLAEGMLPQSNPLGRRVLPVVVQVDDVLALCVTPACQYCVVLAEISSSVKEFFRNEGGPC